MEQVQQQDQHTDTDDIRLVPLTVQELEDVQMTLLGKMMQVTHDTQQGRISSQAAETELEKLGRVSAKVSQYCTQQLNESSEQTML